MRAARVTAFAHADDIRTVTSSLDTLQQQLNTVQNFAAENVLVLNPTKCEVLLVSSSKPASSAPAGVLGNQALIPRHHAKCLGYWWSWDLSVTKAIDEAIRKLGRSSLSLEPWEPFMENLIRFQGRPSLILVLFPSSLAARTGF